MIRKLFKYLWITQEKKLYTENKNPNLGKSYRNLIRLNPWNPLSYLTIATVTPVGILIFGIKGFWREIDKNPFKWQ